MECDFFEKSLEDLQRTICDKQKYSNRWNCFRNKRNSEDPLSEASCWKFRKTHERQRKNNNILRTYFATTWCFTEFAKC